MLHAILSFAWNEISHSLKKVEIKWILKDRQIKVCLILHVHVLIYMYIMTIKNWKYIADSAQDNFCFIVCQKHVQAKAC